MCTLCGANVMEFPRNRLQNNRCALCLPTSFTHFVCFISTAFIFKFTKIISLSRVHKKREMIYCTCELLFAFRALKSETGRARQPIVFKTTNKWHGYLCASSWICDSVASPLMNSSLFVSLPVSRHNWFSFFRFKWRTCAHRHSITRKLHGNQTKNW